MRTIVVTRASDFMGERSASDIGLRPQQICRCCGGAWRRDVRGQAAFGLARIIAKFVFLPVNVASY